jgi:hypothetical protein
MPNRFNLAPDEPKNQEQAEERFESDTQKIVRRHLENEDDVITEEDIRSVRVGMTPPLDEPTEEAIREREEKVADRKQIDENETLPGEEQITPWDVIDQED